jgi:hypothetical protein
MNKREEQLLIDLATCYTNVEIISAVNRYARQEYDRGFQKGMDEGYKSSQRPDNLDEDCLPGPADL